VVFVDEVRSLPEGQRAAMISTPSIYFALEPEERKGHTVLDYDKQWDKDPGFYVRAPPPAKFLTTS